MRFHRPLPRRVRRLRPHRREQPPGLRPPQVRSPPGRLRGRPYWPSGGRPRRHSHHQHRPCHRQPHRQHQPRRHRHHPQRRLQRRHHRQPHRPSCWPRSSHSRRPTRQPQPPRPGFRPRPQKQRSVLRHLLLQSRSTERLVQLRASSNDHRRARRRRPPLVIQRAGNRGGHWRYARQQTNRARITQAPVTMMILNFRVAGRGMGNGNNDIPPTLPSTSTPSKSMTADIFSGL